MLYIDNKCTDVYFNLAAEEYFLKEFDKDIFMIWQNEPSVVMGKHQDVFAEVNIDFARSNDIKIVRRYSGGGTVYQDWGNLNISFIETVRHKIDFDKYLCQITEALKGLGLNPERNDSRSLFLSGQKISGSAQCLYKNRVLFHATLLFDSELNKLNQVLQPDDSYRSLNTRKISVSSVRIPVDNIQRSLWEGINTKDFRGYILNYFLHQKENAQLYEWNAQDVNAIHIIKENRYARSDWNMGKLPEGWSFSKRVV